MRLLTTQMTVGARFGVRAIRVLCGSVCVLAGAACATGSESADPAYTGYHAASCIPETCASLDAECSFVKDPCTKKMLNCGSCPANRVCGAGGPNRCGSAGAAGDGGGSAGAAGDGGGSAGAAGDGGGSGGAAGSGGGAAGSALSCGDGACDPGESCSTCADDCGDCPNTCGNGTCDTGETAATCPDDCDLCGNGTCDNGETAATCPDDCDLCGNGTCDNGEDCTTCPDDCGDCPESCGNGQCDNGEDCTTCPDDCHGTKELNHSCANSSECCNGYCSAISPASPVVTMGCCNKAGVACDPSSGGCCYGLHCNGGTCQ